MVAASYQVLKKTLADKPLTWALTGVAGFIGSNLLQELLSLNQTVIGADNLSTGKASNLDDVKACVTPEQWKRFTFHKGDVSDLTFCRSFITKKIDVVLHQAALGSVPRSIEFPEQTNQSNVNGQLHIMVAMKEAGVKRLVYASSSSIYGDQPAPIKVETQTPLPLSPYAASKLINEIYAKVFTLQYQLETIGLRYFNVFGRRQDPNGPYAAVIPKWVELLLHNKEIDINGDGETSRDFCHVQNAVEANLLAATTQNPKALNEVYNIACQQRTTLNELYQFLKENLQATSQARYLDFRRGDVRHSLADISRARELLGYSAPVDFKQGIRQTLEWYKKTSS